MSRLYKVRYMVQVLRLLAWQSRRGVCVEAKRHHHRQHRAKLRIWEELLRGRTCLGLGPSPLLSLTRPRDCSTSCWCLLRLLLLVALLYLPQTAP